LPERSVLLGMVNNSDQSDLAFWGQKPAFTGHERLRCRGPSRPCRLGLQDITRDGRFPVRPSTGLWSMRSPN